MVPTFILTRTFAISALFVGAFPVIHAAPIPSAAVPSTHAARSCRQMGCLYALPTDNSDSDTLDSSNSTTVSTTLTVPAGGFSQQSMQVIDFLISALSAARDASTSVASDIVEPAVDVVTVDGFVPDATVAELANEVAAKKAALEERELPRADVAARDSTSLDSLD